MIRRPTIISDQDVAEILKAPREVSSQDLAARFGLSVYTIGKYRGRRISRAVRVAQENGLLQLPAARSQWQPGRRGRSQ